MPEEATGRSGVWGEGYTPSGGCWGPAGLMGQADADGREESLIKNRDLRRKKKGLARGEVFLTSMSESQEATRVDAEAQGFLLEHKGLVSISLVYTRDCSFSEMMERGG